MSDRYVGKVGLVTGAASGMGRAAALAFAREGAAVVVADVDEAGIAAVAEQIAGVGGRAEPVVVDVSVADQVQHMVQTAVDRFGRLDFAFNNAGITKEQAALTELAEATWDQVVDVDLKGIWLGMKYEIPVMVAAGGGAIVNTLSMASLKITPTVNPAYASAKAGGVQLTKFAAVAYGPQGVRVNAICPGITLTPMASAAGSEEAMRAFAKQVHPLGIPAEAEDIANAALFLASDDARLITGAVLPVDGGWTAT